METNYDIERINRIIQDLESLKIYVEKLKDHKNYVENKLMVEMKKNSIISLITII